MNRGAFSRESDGVCRFDYGGKIRRVERYALFRTRRYPTLWTNAMAVAAYSICWGFDVTDLKQEPRSLQQRQQ
jgi:uncharacterized membrane protein (DUF2068 family)